MSDIPDAPAIGEVALEVIAPDGSSFRVPVSASPFFIGRGDAGNQLPLADKRISRQCAAVVSGSGGYYLEDRGHRLGIFVNREKISRKLLQDGDVVTFGLDDSYTLTFRFLDGAAPLQTLLTRMDSVVRHDADSSGLGKLNLLLEATKLLHSQLPLDAVLEAMVDRAVAITNADRGLLLEADSSGTLRERLARHKDSTSIPAQGFSPSQTAVTMALQQKSGVITEDMHQAAALLQGAQSVIAQRLRAVVAIPLYAMPHANTAESIAGIQRGQFLGVLYLDSRRPAAFSKLDRQILDAIAIQSASILDNARLVERERERQRIEGELSIARDIQQALLPSGLRDFPHLAVSGMNIPCHQVGGDYFDVFSIDEHHTAFLIADVSGKGLGAALVTTMLQGALSGMTIGANPARVFQHINRFLCERSGVGRHATVFFGILDSRGNLEYLNAGHPSPLLLRRGEAVELYTEGSLPVGLVSDAEYVVKHATLEPQDALVLFSDGISEAEDITEQQFGIPRLQALLAGQHGLSLGALQQKIIESVKEFSGPADQSDDVTLLLVRYCAPESSAASGT